MQLAVLVDVVVVAVLVAVVVLVAVSVLIAIVLLLVAVVFVVVVETKFRTESVLVLRRSCFGVCAHDTNFPLIFQEKKITCLLAPPPSPQVAAPSSRPTPSFSRFVCPRFGRLAGDRAARSAEPKMEQMKKSRPIWASAQKSHFFFCFATILRQRFFK